MTDTAGGKRYYWIHIRCKDEKTVEEWRKLLYEFRSRGITAEELIKMMMELFKRYYVKGTTI